MKRIYLTMFIMAFYMCSFAEGTLQLITCPTCEAGISINDKAQFAYPGLTEERRLHIRVGDFTNEEIYVALGQTDVGGAWFSRLVSPSGVQYTYDGTGFVAGGTPATLPVAITSAAENSAGPNGVIQAGAAAATTGSYTSTVFAPNENGDWYIEFTDDAGFGIPTVSARVPLWDISVVDLATTAVINGRLWSEQWGLRSGPGAQNDPGDFLASTFFVYTEPEMVVTAIEIGDSNDPGWGGDWLIACNRYGIDNAAFLGGNPAAARQSYDGDADADFGPLSEYKIFVNEPDIIEFPSGIQDIQVDVISVDLCDDGNSFISFVTNVQAVGDIILDFPPQSNNGPEDVPITATLINPGANSIPWNGFDGQGNLVPAGTSFFVRLFAGASTVHFPMFDIEGVTGMKARLVRPGTPGFIGLYWDNSQIPPDNAANPVTEIADPGCISSPTVACNAYGNSNNRTLNMWWNGLETNIEDEVIVPAPAGATIEAGTPEAVCDQTNDEIIIPLNGVALGVTVIEWTTSGTGTFDDVNMPNAVYSPSLADIAAGAVTLTMGSFACPEVADEAIVDINEQVCLLPIRLSDFAAALVDVKDHCEGIKVTWTTETEENTDYYILESSANGADFEFVGRINAAGNSLTVQNYTLTDTDINSINYYRLTAYDLDGTTESFMMGNTVQTDCFGNIAPNTISELFPNPVHNNDMVSLKVNVTETTNAIIQVKDLNGRTVSNVPVNLSQGESIVEFNLDGLNAGIYFVNINGDNWTTDFKKLVKIQ